MKRKKIIIVFGLFLFTLWMIWGNTTLQISHVTISASHLPEGFNGFKIAHLSDLHDKNWGTTLIVPREEEQPDIIVITGDLVDANNPDIEQASNLVSQLKNIAPIYYVTGNHEAWTEYYPLLEESLREHDVTILDNASVTIQRDGAEILLLGVQDPDFIFESDLFNEQPGIVDAEIRKLVDNDDGYRILLSHRPELFDVYVENQMDIVLSGHAHGGQFRLPFIGGLFAPNQGFFPKYTTGVYKEGRTHMIVSRGLGSSSIPIRVNNRPELLFIQLANDF